MYVCMSVCLYVCIKAAYVVGSLDFTHHRPRGQGEPGLSEGYGAALLDSTFPFMSVTYTRGTGNEVGLKTYKKINYLSISMSAR